MSKINVLIFPAGAENALEIYNELRYCVNIEVFGASGKSDHASFVYPKDKYFEGDYYINDKNFFQNFNTLLEKNKIDVVIPTHDTIAKFFAGNRDNIKAKILTADSQTADICRSKSKTFKLLKDENFIPKVYNNADEIKSEDFPLFLKPDIGEGAKGTKLVKNREELFNELKKDPELMIFEYLPNEEYTVDCFTDRFGKLQFVGLRTRERITMGIAFRSKTIKAPAVVKEIANIINSKLKFLGAWFFQLKKDNDGNFKLLEVSCRQAGTMTLYRNKGINFALLGVYEIMGKDTCVLENDYELIVDRCIESKFKFDYKYNQVYIDYDDTIVFKNSVNIEAIAFLYYCKNNNIKITLISRHEGCINESLKNNFIDKNLFDEIIVIGPEQSKVSYITNTKAIFIDNSFAERKQVFKMLNIPVFDVDAISGLIIN